MTQKFSGKALSGLLIGTLLLSGYSLTAHAQTDPEELAKAVREIEKLDALRSGLASTLEGQAEKPTLKTMKKCL